MATRHQDELLFDSEASLRLVDRALTDLRITESAGSSTRGEEPDRRPGKEGALMDLPNMLLQAYTEINSVLQNLRQSRDVLQQTTLDKLQHTSDKLREVSSATELAATDMLDGLDRALAMVDELESITAEQKPGEAADLHGSLRNELFGLMNCLQFQDITTQQLGYASGVLVEMEKRLTELARIFDPDRFGFRGLSTELTDSADAAFDPAATTSDAKKRQALVDEIFTAR